MPARFPASLRRLALVLPCLVLGACSSLPSFKSLASVSGEKVMGLVTPYRVEIVQGNVVTKEQIAQVKPGMTREQVRSYLGTPLLTDVFHADRWDYFFSIRRQGQPFEQRKVIAWFDGDKLKSIDAPDNLPSENEFVASIARKPRSDKLPKLELSDAERQALPLPKPEASAPAADDRPLRQYPPLASNP
ncbi:MAG: outer membrane protein assembly factor BamE [Pelomonas sp.]|nr:outer membrane protein assembly factor BamE [Roseateles sp.]